MLGGCSGVPWTWWRHLLRVPARVSAGPGETGKPRPAPLSAGVRAASEGGSRVSATPVEAKMRLRAIDVSARSDPIDGHRPRSQVDTEEDPPVADAAAVCIRLSLERSHVASEWIGGHLLDSIGDALARRAVSSPEHAHWVMKDRDPERG